jgi:hypothetical protein
MGIPLVAGRTCDSRDREGTNPVAIVNRTFVKQHFSTTESIGKRIRWSGARTEDPLVITSGSSEM